MHLMALMKVYAENKDDVDAWSSKIVINGNIVTQYFSQNCN